ncbi:hypothetical protein ACWCQL_10535 [Streptomyces sp. NPDC002073]
MSEPDEPHRVRTWIEVVHLNGEDVEFEIGDASTIPFTTSTGNPSAVQPGATPEGWTA